MASPVDSLGLGSFSQIGTTAISTVVYCLMALIIIAVLGGAVWFFKTQWKSYDVEVRIYSKRKNGYKTWIDQGAYLKNRKTGEVYGFKLKHDKTLIQPPPFDMLMTGLKGNCLHLLQLTSDEYFVLDPAIDLNEEILPDKTKIMRLKVIEGDIQLWATQMIDKLYSMYDRKGFWDKYGSYIIFATCAVMCIVMIYIIVQKFDVLSTVASNLNEAAQALREFKQSGAMIPAGG